MTVIIAYDIPDDHVRRRVAGYLEGTGIRVKESVFECILSVEEMNVAALKLKGLLEGEGDIRLYPLCGSCYGKALHVGLPVNSITKGSYLIV